MQGNLIVKVESGNTLDEINRLDRALRALTVSGNNASGALSHVGNASTGIRSVGANFGAANGTINNFNRNISNVTNNVNNLNQSVSNSNNTINNFNIVVNNADNRVSHFNNTVNNTSNSVNNLAHNVNNVNGSLNNAANAARGTTGAFSGLSNVLTGLLSAATALSVIKTADDMQSLNSQVMLVTKSTEEYEAVQYRLRAIASDTQKDIGATIGLYQNSARALQRMGKSQQDILNFTKAVSLAMATGGKSANEQKAALLQLGQAMQSGVVQGDEFRSIGENAPVLLDLVAKALNTTREEVKGLASEGKITAEVMYSALAGATDELQAKFNSLPTTMGASFTLVTNKVKESISDTLNATDGFASDVVSGLQYVAKNFNALGTIALGVSALFATKVATGFVAASLAAKGFTTSQMLATNAVAANAIATRISTTASAIYNTTMIVGVRAYVSATAATTALATATGVYARAMAIANVATAAGARLITVMAGGMRGLAVSMGTGVATGLATVAGGLLNIGKILNAHPLMFLATVMFGVVASTEGLQGAMDSLGDAFKVVGVIASNFIAIGVEGFTSLMNYGGRFVNSLVNGTRDGANKGQQNLSVFFQGTEKGFVGIIQGVANMADSAFLTVFSLGEKVLNHIKNIGTGTVNAVKWVGDQLGMDVTYGSYKETNFSKLMDGNASAVFGGGLGSIVNDAIAKVNNDKLIASQNALAASNYDLSKGNAQQAKAYQDAMKALNEGKNGGKIAGLSKEQSNNLKMLLVAFKNAGLSDKKAAILAGEVGRENDLQSRYLWGAHMDSKRVNIGMISWNNGVDKNGNPKSMGQGGRGDDIYNALKRAGLITGSGLNTKMVRSQEALDVQAKFLVNEMRQKYSKAAAGFLDKSDDALNVNAASALLGDYYIGWDRAGKSIGKNKLAEHNAKIVKYRNAALSVLGSGSLGVDAGYNASNQDAFYREQENKAKQAQERTLALKESYASKEVALRMATQKRIDEINGEGKENNLTPAERTAMIAKENKKLTLELKAISDEQNKAINDILSFKTSPSQAIQNKAKIDKDAAELKYMDDPAALATVKKAIDERTKYELAANNLVNAERLQSVTEWQQTQREALVNNAALQIAKIRQSNSETKLIDEQNAKDQLFRNLDLLNLENRAKLNSLSEYNKTRQQIEAENADIEIKRILLGNSESKEAEIKAVQAKLQFTLKNLDIEDKIKLDSLNEYRKTELEIIKDTYDNKVASIKASASAFKTEELAAAEYVYKHDRDLALLAQKERMQQLSDYSKSNLQKIDEKWDREAERARLSIKDQQELTAALALMDANRELEKADAKAENARKVSGIKSDLYGGKDILDLRTQMEDRQKLIEESLKNEAVTREEYNQLMLDNERDMHVKSMALKLGYFNYSFSAILNLTKSFAGEQSKTYKAMFYAEKAFNFAGVMLNSFGALAKAWNSAPFPANLVAVGTTAAQTGVLQAAIQAITPKGFKTGGFTGFGNVNDVAGLVHKEEFVFNAQATRNIGVNNLQNLASGKGFGNVNVVVNNNAPVDVTTRKLPNGGVELNINPFANLANPDSYESRMLRQHTSARAYL